MIFENFCILPFRDRMNTKQCLEHPWITGVVSPESPLGGEDCSDNEEKMVESCEDEEKSAKISEKEIEVRKQCCQSNDSVSSGQKEDSLSSGQKEVNILLNQPDSPDNSIPSKILKCNSNSNILDECENGKSSENVTVSCSQKECNVKDNYGIDDVNSNLSTQSIVL